MNHHLYSTGSNSHGQLSNSTLIDYTTFQPVLFHSSSSSTNTTANAPGRVLDIVFGATHSLLHCETSQGEEEGKGKKKRRTDVYISGSNARGQLAQSDQRLRLAFEKVDVRREWLEECLEDEEQQGGDEDDWEINHIAASWETSFISFCRRGHRSDILLATGANDWSERANGSREINHEGKRRSWVNRITFDHLRTRHEQLVKSVIKIIDLQAGPRHILARIEINGVDPRTSRRLLVGWGAARHGQLGQLEQSKGGQAAIKVIDRPSIIQFPSSVPPSIHDDVTQIALGRDHSILLTPTTIYLLGSSKQHQLGPRLLANGIGTIDRNDADVAITIGASWSSSYVLSSSTSSCNKRLHAFGSNSHHQLAAPSTISSSSSPLPVPLSSPLDSSQYTVIELACGSEHTMVLRANEGGERQVMSWGWNEHGNVGNGSLTDVETPQIVWPSSDTERPVGGRVTKIWAGNATSWIQVESELK